MSRPGGCGLAARTPTDPPHSAPAPAARTHRGRCRHRPRCAQQCRGRTVGRRSGAKRPVSSTSHESGAVTQPHPAPRSRHPPTSCWKDAMASTPPTMPMSNLQPWLGSRGGRGSRRTGVQMHVASVERAWRSGEALQPSGRTQRACRPWPPPAQRRARKLSCGLREGAGGTCVAAARLKLHAPGKPAGPTHRCSAARGRRGGQTAA